MTNHNLAGSNQILRSASLAVLACAAGWLAIFSLARPSPTLAQSASSLIIPANATRITTESLALEYRQIVIEGLVLEVDSSSARALGLSWVFSRDESSEPSNAILKGVGLQESGDFPTENVPVFIPGSDSLGYVPGVGVRSAPVGIGGVFDGMRVDSHTFIAQVRAAVTMGKAEILSQPIAVALNNTTANLATVDEIPFQDIRTSENYVATVNNTILEISKRDAGISLEVTPRLTPDGRRIALEIKNLKVGQVVGYEVVRGVPRPTIQTASVNTQVALADRESLLISGIKAVRERRIRRGIPVLKDIPVLGYLFSKSTDTQERVDILFMITPHLLDPGQNPLLPREFQNRSGW